ncbi:hypothetical protein E5288_WYG002359 [Bos mutus]|uniref:Uncharacterized protein n=1 Tax=Bos mutus TaxID=72004 RepID=A0A6B0R8U1_9CETA|nr:hypothetical protein [Bos mutus]
MYSRAGRASRKVLQSQGARCAESGPPPPVRALARAGTPNGLTAHDPLACLRAGPSEDGRGAACVARTLRRRACDPERPDGHHCPLRCQLL